MAKGTLKGYEAQNLIFFLCFIVALGGVGFLVFVTIRDKDKVPPKEVNTNGILDEVVSSTANSCYFYLDSELPSAARRYRSKREIPADDGLATGLFAIPGVIEVTIDKSMVVLQKEAKAHWEEIRPKAREIIGAQLHPQK